MIRRMLLDVAAADRITELVVEDEITRPAREWVEDKWPDSQVAYLVSCPLCVSVWAGGLVLILPRPVKWALAVSACVIKARWLTGILEVAARGK